MQYAFDAGHLFVTPQNGSPVRIGSVQEIKIDVERTLVMERLGFQVPAKAAHSETRLKGRARTAQINGALFAEIFFGQATTPGSTQAHDGCAFTIPANPGPYTVTVTPPAGGTYAEDLGVRFAADAPQLVRVAGPPAAGQYSVAANVYTFNAADAAKGVLISFTYTLATGKTLTILNPYWIEAPQFALLAYQAYGGKQVLFKFPTCVSEHLSIATILENFTIPEFSFEVISDPSEPRGLVGTISTAE